MRRTLLIRALLIAASIIITAGTQHGSAQGVSRAAGLMRTAQPVLIQRAQKRRRGRTHQSKRQPKPQPQARTDAADEQALTPLMHAAGKGDLQAVKDLLAQGADVNGSSGDGYTALIYAAFYGNAEVVEYLLDHGAEVNAKDKKGLTALIEAAKQYMDAGDVIASYVDTVRALLKKGADVNARDKDGMTARAYAEKYGLRNKAEIVRLLKDAGAKK